jgi:hypothetical protein
MRILADRIKAMVFFATPHSNTNLEGTLSTIISASGLGLKAFMRDIASDARSVQAINDQFRPIAQNMIICSFYERLRTKLAGSTVKVVDTDSALMGMAKTPSSNTTFC